MNKAYQYTGKPIMPTFVLNIGDKALESGVDYTVNYTDNIDVGTAKVEIIGKGKFKGIVNRTFDIKPAPANALEFYTDNTSFEYDGEPKMLNLSVKYGEISLEEGKDYVVDYADNINVGTAIAKISFMGNYTGITKIPFTIEGLANTSEISAQEIYFGKGITIKGSAIGGTAPYKYAYYSKTTDQTKWRMLSDYTIKQNISFVPSDIKEHTICVKVIDSEGKTAKKYMSLSVKSKIDLTCKLSHERIKVNGKVNVKAEVNGGEEPYTYSYYIRHYGEQKWTFLQKGEDCSETIFNPAETGIYDICIKVEDTEKYFSKQYLKVIVTE